MGTPRLDALDKNYLINGSFDFWQRALTVATVAATPAYYAADRWRNNTINQAFTVRRALDLPANSKSRYSLEYNTVSAIGAIDREMQTEQRIESVFSKELSGKKVSLKLSYKSQSATQLRVIIKKPTALDNHASTDTIFDEVVTILNDGSWGTYLKEDLLLPDVSNGLSVDIRFQNTVLLVGASHFLADIKLSIGTKAQDFSFAGRNYEEELRLCQRYFEKSLSLDTPPTEARSNNVASFRYRAKATSTGEIPAFHSFKVLKRSTPATIIYSTSGAPNFFRDIEAATDKATTDYTSNESGFSKTNIVALVAGNSYTWDWTADAEI